MAPPLILAFASCAVTHRGSHGKSGDGIGGCDCRPRVPELKNEKERERKKKRKKIRGVKKGLQK